MKSIPLSIFLVLLIASCAHAQEEPQLGPFGDRALVRGHVIAKGMTTSELEAVIGKPHTIQKSEDGSFELWMYEANSRRSQWVVVRSGVVDTVSGTYDR
jgi:hypothetical protein